MAGILDFIGVSLLVLVGLAAICLVIFFIYSLLAEWLANNSD